eukprot:187191_1
MAQGMCRMMCVISAGSAANWIDRSAWCLKYSDFVGKVDEYQDADGDIEMHQDKKKRMTDLVHQDKKKRMTDLVHQDKKKRMTDLVHQDKKKRMTDLVHQDKKKRMTDLVHQDKKKR